MMKVTFNTKPLKLTIIAAYAPHARIGQPTKDKFYDKLTDIVEESKNHR